MPLGADILTTTYLMASARREASQLVQTFSVEIFAVARALRERRTLVQHEIDGAVAFTRVSSSAISPVVVFTPARAAAL